MTLSQLKNRVRVTWKGYGTFETEIVFRGKKYRTITHNSWAYDRIRGNDDWISDREIHNLYTLKQAYKALWDECVRNNFD